MWSWILRGSLQMSCFAKKIAQEFQVREGNSGSVAMQPTMPLSSPVNVS